VLGNKDKINLVPLKEINNGKNINKRLRKISDLSCFSKIAINSCSLKKLAGLFIKFFKFKLISEVTLGLFLSKEK
jgi:hypothetical protein